MQTLNTLWQAVSAVSSIRDIARHDRTYYFAVQSPSVTFYLAADNATVQIIRWARPLIEVSTSLQGAFGWRIATEQDEAGVYMAAKRRNVFGGLSSARFEARVPHDTYLMLRLESGAVFMDNVTGLLKIPPQQDLAATITPPLLTPGNP